ncbi:aromatic acid exporter family protein [Clostridium sp. NSJ-6]|uniref:Aromatic acid exporter family protein n=1 Tax=Clostridium hominis TaxID=2763036 RepID=A0ABR7DBX6_9CLOT|nr:aromatic acid exporter family protein [Clostridium hominis]
MKYIYNLAFKMALSATIALVIGESLGFKYSTVAAVIAILGIQDTRRKALIVGRNRAVACIIGQILSLIVYGILGNGAISFGIFLLILIPITSRLKIQEGMIASVVLSTHLLVADKIDLPLIINEFGIMIIGIGVASIANLFMPALEDEFRKDKIWIEEKYKVILLKMSKSLLTQTVDIDEQKIMDDIEKNLIRSNITAYKIVNNNFFKSSSYYTDYIAMRRNQFDTIKKMRKNFERFSMPVDQMKNMAMFLKRVAEDIRENNDCKEHLYRLEKLKLQYKNMELPKTREEFENRAQLLNLLNDMEDFLNIKRNFILNNKIYCSHFSQDKC